MLKKNTTRKELYNKVSQSLGFSKNVSANIVDNFFELLIEDLIKTNKIKISSFGTFVVANKKERLGRNPKTKIEAKISARKVVKFKPSESVKEKINS
tara:strand:- start:4585 stop:4875 length:291 start_codon:yes stop_codon:yes gene_type:complete